MECYKGETFIPGQEEGVLKIKHTYTHPSGARRTKEQSSSNARKERPCTEEVPSKSKNK